MVQKKAFNLPEILGDKNDGVISRNYKTEELAEAIHVMQKLINEMYRLGLVSETTVANSKL